MSIRTIVVALVVACGLLPALPASAVAITVDSTADLIAVDGLCTLREAIRAANSDTSFSDCPAGSGADTIALAADIYTLSLGPSGDQAGFEGDLDVVGGSDVTIVGQGVGATVVDGNDFDRVFDVAFNGSLTITGLEIVDGIAAGSTVTDCQGGAIRNAGGTVVLNDSLIANSFAGEGGAIYNIGTITLNDTTVRQNTGAKVGGGISNGSGGTTTLNRSTVEQNLHQATAFDQPPCANVLGSVGGGGIANAGGVTLEDSTVALNDAGGGGGGIFNLGSDASLVLDRGTISDNSTSTQGGGIYNSNGSATITNSTLSGNTASIVGDGILNQGLDTSTTLDSVTVKNVSGDIGLHVVSGAMDVANSIVDAWCEGAVTSLGHNVDAFGTCPFFEAGDQQNVDPALLSLADNGGHTETHRLHATSAAIDTGSCPALAADQRGVPRPQGAGCDVGAFETTPPSSAITFPRARSYRSSTYGAACGDVFKDVCGSAAPNADGAAVAGVEISLQRASDNAFWDGASFQPGPETWIAASGTTSWSYQFVPSEDTYRLRSRATDGSGYVGSTAEVIFRIDDTAPEAEITRARIQRAQRRATFRFKSNEPGAKFQCRIDGRPFRNCASPKVYENLKPGWHTFRVRARDVAGNVGRADVERFRI